ncbi:MAG: hypothetical protein Q9210_005995 [Variospora velana]
MFDREDVLELHVHGGTAVIRSVLGAIPLVPAIKQGSSGIHIIRYAEPGEFTRRAFYNNRLDLTQIEALGDTLSAETEQQRRIAVRGNSSVLSQKYESWRRQLLYARGELEALIDFSEDQHFDESPAKLVTSVTEQVLGLQRQIKAAMENASRGELLRNGISLALLGAPNAGKSSVLNQIVGREAAIVSEEAGTTRDVIDVGVDVGGFYCTFGDLAGLRTKSLGSQFDIGLVEQEGMKRARERALVADVIIVLVPIERRQSGDGTWHSHLELNAEIAATLKLCHIRRQRVVYAINKIDLIGPNEDTAAMQGLMQQQLSDQDLPAPAIPILAVSCKPCQQRSQDYSDLQPLLASLTGLFQDMTATSELDTANWESSLGASHRQRILLEQCFNELRNYLDQVNRDLIDHDLVDDGVDVVLAAECLRSAADYLAKITGKGQVANIEEVLGVVFEKFVQLYAFYPVTKTMIRAIGSLYFGIFFNLSPHGPWANIPPMSHVVLHAGGLYLEFLSPDPRVPVPWSFVKDWAEALDMNLNMGGFIGEYIASFERLTGDQVIDYWVRLGTAPPPLLAAAAAKRKRLKE